MKKDKNKVSCSDWYRGWGYGYTLLGTLEISIVEDCPINFIWRGSSQGRHGQKHWSGGMCRYMLLDDRLEITESKHTTYGPYNKDVIEAANILLRQNGYPELPEDFKIVKNEQV